jgi:hypothetical protein
MTHIPQIRKIEALVHGYSQDEVDSDSWVWVWMFDKLDENGIEVGHFDWVFRENESA